MSGGRRGTKNNMAKDLIFTPMMIYNKVIEIYNSKKEHKNVSKCKRYAGKG